MSGAVLCLALALAASPVQDAGLGRAAALLASGNRHYEEGRYGAAAEDYQRILDYGIRDGVVHYNLGNALFKQGRLGEAILSYERALALNPRDREAADNLAYATSLTVDQVATAELVFPWNALRWVLERTTPEEDALLLALGVYLLGATGATAILARPGRRRPLLYIAVMLGLLGAVSAAELGWKENRRTIRRGVILMEKVDALSGPAVDNTPLFTVHEGLRVRIRNERGDWVQILLPNGLNGWVPRASLGIV